MALSGDITFNETRDQIIADAMTNIGALAAGETPSDNDTQFAARTLNRMLLAWQAQDLHLWLRTEAILFLQAGQNTYNFTNSTNGDHCTNISIETQVNTTCVANSTTIILNSVVGMTVGDHIGVIMDNNTTYWDTIQNINTGAKTITFTSGSGITAQATANNYVHTYTNKINRPLRILQARRYQYIGQQDVPMSEEYTGLAREEYFDLPNKTSPNQVVDYYYDPQIGTGILYVWGSPSDSNYAVKFTYLRQINDLINATDTVELPTEWLEPIVYNLSVRLCPAYGKQSQLPVLVPVAEKMLEILKAFDTEKTYLQFTPRSKY